MDITWMLLAIEVTCNFPHMGNDITRNDEITQKIQPRQEIEEKAKRDLLEAIDHHCGSHRTHCVDEKRDFHQVYTNLFRRYLTKALVQGLR